MKKNIKSMLLLTLVIPLSAFALLNNPKIEINNQTTYSNDELMNFIEVSKSMGVQSPMVIEFKENKNNILLIKNHKTNIQCEFTMEKQNNTLLIKNAACAKH